MEWRYQGQDYTEQHDPSLYGFTYIVHFENESGDVFSYYGKKKWNSETNILQLKSGIQRENSVGVKRKRIPMSVEEMAGRTKAQRRMGVNTKIVSYDKVLKESKWRSYTGSCKETEGLIPIHKEIIEFAKTSRELTYMETKILFVKGALEDDKCLNANIMGRFYRDNLV